MKTILAVLFLSSLSFAKTAPGVLISFSSGGGFTRFPMSTKVTISENGKVESTRLYGKSANEVAHKELVAIISHEAIENLEKKIEAIDSKAKLVDPDQEGPRCMDTPVTRISIVKEDRTEITISLEQTCHQSLLEKNQGSELIQIINTFVNLSDYN
jgi:hypothetical protein